MSKNPRSFVSCMVASLALAACATAPSERTSADVGEVRAISKAEALADFDQIAASFRGLYGATSRKEQRYGFKFEPMVKAYRARVGHAKSEAEVFGIFQEFVARFHDAHVSLFGLLTDDKSQTFGLPFLVMPVENTYVVYSTRGASGPTGPQIGEELLSIDGVSAKDLVAQFSKYDGFPTEQTRKHMAAMRLTFREPYLARGIAENVPAKIRLRNAEGVEREEVMGWTLIEPFLLPVAPPPHAGASSARGVVAASETVAKVVSAELSELGSRVPFFMTDRARAALSVTTETKPSPAALAKFNVSPEAAAKVNYFAVTYSIGTKKVLFLRIPKYIVRDVDAALNYLRALFDEQASQVDGLIVDETHNPGGYVGFAESVITLLAKTPVNGMVQRMHADRNWIEAFATGAIEVRYAPEPDLPLADALDRSARLIDTAYSTRKALSAPLPFFRVSPILQPDAAHWTKPVMMLTDELSVSCADFVPLVLKANGAATLFGQTTMGGGGNVEEVATLTNTRARLSLSRGLGTVFDPTGAYPEATVIEDNGVAPDVSYAHTLADFRAGYVGYVSAFNAAFAQQLGQ